MRRLIPKRRRTQFLMVAAALILVVIVLGNLDDEATESGAGGATAATTGDAPVEQGRTFALALAATPPVLTNESVLEVIDRLPALAEYALIQREPPWAELLAGQTPDEVIAVEYTAMIERMRERGLQIILLVDPLDGLDRRREPPALVEAGRSIVEPEIVAMYEQWVLTLATRFEPAYLGLASEINTPAAHGRPDLYTAIRDVTNRLTPQLRAITPDSTLFVSFQVDDAWGLWEGDSDVDQFALVEEFDVDLIGLSSYPMFEFDSPADIPDDYYQRFAEVAGGRPLGQFEGGWGSATTANGFAGSPELQAQWVRRIEALLDGVEAHIWAHLTLTDLELATWGLPADRAETLSLFATMGLTDSEFTPKPAYAEWQRMHARPLITAP